MADKAEPVAVEGGEPDTDTTNHPASEHVSPAPGAEPSGAGGASEPDYAELREQLTRAVRRICPPWLASQADDIVQEAMIRLMRVIRTSDSDRELKASYLWRVAHTTTIDEIRRRKADREVSLDDDGTARIPDDDSPSPERVARGSQLQQGLRDCLGGLNDDRRRAVTLYLQGHGVTEAAALLGYPHKRTENLIYRGLASLRDCLSSKGFSL